MLKNSPNTLIFTSTTPYLPQPQAFTFSDPQIYLLSDEIFRSILLSYAKVFWSYT